MVFRRHFQNAIIPWFVNLKNQQFLPLVPWDPFWYSWNITFHAKKNSEK